MTQRDRLGRVIQVLCSPIIQGYRKVVWGLRQIDHLSHLTFELIDVPPDLSSVVMTNTFNVVFDVDRQSDPNAGESIQQ